ncbi:RNA polymerase sigma factor [Subtercola sp. YIM 133946]|uniref:RNA polymerase sigma factor n=1 Tax=Subtercola sp. YIM 133946 TaxID=3118909 RepID=UPI002F946E43
MTTPIAEAVTRLAHEQSGRVVALLAHRFSDLDLADEAVQDALLSASQWTTVPDNPAAWLYTVARNNAIDRLRRAAAERRRLRAAAPDLLAAGLDASGDTRSPGEDAEAEEEVAVDDDSGPGDEADEQVRLMLLCCHPALDRSAQVALTLRLVGGLTTAEIAAALLVPEATLAQRIVRAKRKIRDAGIPLSMPADLDGRIEVLLTVLYLVFNEGYLARGGRPGIRVDLVDEAIRLTRRARDVLPESAEVEGLLALELFTHARTGGRQTAAGELVLLADQDRTRWNLDLVAEANVVLADALQRLKPGPFQLQAVVSGSHSTARTAADTDWAMIAGAYRQLAVLAPSPIVSLNHAVAVSMADGARAGLAMLDAVDGLDEYYLLWAARGEMLERAGSRPEAIDALRRARALALNPAEQRHLDRRLAALGAPGDGAGDGGRGGGHDGGHADVSRAVDGRRDDA